MRQTTRLSIAAALLAFTALPALAQGSAPAPSGSAPASRPAAVATPANPGGSVTQSQPAQRPATQGTVQGQASGNHGSAAQRPATPGTTSGTTSGTAPSGQAPRATN